MKCRVRTRAGWIVIEDVAIVSVDMNPIILFNAHKEVLFVGIFGKGVDYIVKVVE